MAALTRCTLLFSTSCFKSMRNRCVCLSGLRRPDGAHCLHRCPLMCLPALLGCLWRNEARSDSNSSFASHHRRKCSCDRVHALAVGLGVEG